MAAHNSFVIPNPRDKHSEPAPTKLTPLEVVVAFLCAPVVLCAGGAGYLWATGQTIALTPGGLPRLAPATVQAAATLPARPQPVPTQVQVHTPARPAAAQPVPQALSQNLSEPLPMPVVQRPSSVAQAVARRAANGHFHFDTVVNGAAVPMMFDTGASVVVLRWEDAIQAGVDPGSLTFNVRASTANGVGEAASVSIGTLRVGGITRTNVRAVVVRQGKLRQSLLGQSFLTSLAGHQVEGDRLVLKGE